MVSIGAVKTITITLVLLISGLWAIFITEPAGSVTGSITSNQTWSGYVNVTGDVYVEDGVKLTVSAGTTVELRGNYGIFLAPNATLDVQGTSGNEISFFNDTQASWKGIYLNTSSSTAWFNYARIYNCIDGISANSSGTLTVRNSTIDHSIFGVQGVQCDPLIENSHIHNCSYPLFFQKVNGTVIHNEFRNNTNSIIWLDSMGQPKFDDNNVINSGSLSGSNAIDLSTTNVHFTNNTIESAGGNGVSFSHCSAYVYNNTIINNGRNTGNAGIYVYANAFKDTTIIDNNKLSSNYNGLVLGRNSGQTESAILCTVTNNDIHHNMNAGVVISNWSAPDFQFNDVHNNSYGIKAGIGDPIIANSSIVNNAVFDFYVVDYSRPVSLNTKYGSVSVTVNRPEQYLKVIWFLHVKVTNSSSGLPVANIDVKLSTMAAPTQILHYRITDPSGEAKFIHVEERVIYNSATTVNSPFQITAEDGAWPKAYVKKTVSNYNLPNLKTLTINLAPNLPPTAPANIKPTTTHKTQFQISWDKSTEPNSETITYYYKLGTTSGAGNIIPESSTTNEFVDLSITLTHNVTYFFCVCANDESGLSSAWACAAIHIQNIHPGAPTIMATPSIIFTNTDIDINMTIPSQDDPKEVSDFGERIKYYVLVKINDEVKVDYKKDFVWAQNVDFTIKNNDFEKGDEINVTVTPYDGHGDSWNASEGPSFAHPSSGVPTTLILFVKNSPPVVAESIDDIVFDEDTVYTLPHTFTDIFSDPDNDTMSFVQADTDDITVTYNQNTKEISLIPDPDYFTPTGTSDHVIIGADDSDGGITNITLNIKITEVNDAPLLHVDEPQVAYQGKRHYINITTTDPADAHDLSSLDIVVDYSEWPFAANMTKVEHSNDNITIYFTATNDDIGKFNLSITASDGKDNNEKVLAVTVINVNDRPFKPVVISPAVVNGKIYQVYNTTNDIHFEVSAGDPDEKWGDELSVLWTSNISGLTIGNKFEFITKINLGGHHRITVTVTDEGGLTNSVHFDVFVIGIPPKDLPKTELIYPTDNLVFPSMTPTKVITLKWEPIYHEYSDFFVYDLEYWEEGQAASKSRVNGLAVTEFDFTATVEKTYVWTVIPTLGGPSGVIGQCYSGEWTFEIILDGDPTKSSVELWNPISGQTFNSTTVELEWISDEENSEYYYYQLYLDENPTPSTLFKNYITDKEFSASGLKDKTTYYWDIKPIFGDVAGISTNGPFSFKIDSDFIPNPDMDITGDSFEFTMEPGEQATFTYTVENSGNTYERVTISVEPDNILADKVEGYNETEIILAPGDTEVLVFTVDLSDLGEGDYDIKLKVVTEDKDLIEQPDVTITVKQQEVSDGDGPWMIIVLVILIVVIIVVLLLYLMKRGRPKTEEEADEGDDKSGREDVLSGPEPLQEPDTESTGEDQAGDGTTSETEPEQPPPVE